MIRAAVVDTNVLAAGLMTTNVKAPTACVLDRMLSGDLPFVVSSALLAEYRDVLNRPKLRDRHGLTRRDVESLLIAVAEMAIVIEPDPGPSAPEPGDQHLWDLLASRDDLCLVTGDALLIGAPNPPSPILSPADFMAHWPVRA